jgi:UDP-4-amino-4,6-dideoxy-N-acetyl-beta-L-altrosamine transaminase
VKIPYSCPDINQGDIASVSKILKTRNITQGKEVKYFEDNLSSLVKSKYSIVLNSATSALHLACRALNVGSKSIVWLPTNTFVATSNAVLFCGGKIDLVDIDYKTRNISVEKLKEKLISAKNKNKLPFLVIVVHFSGYPCDLKEIYQLSMKYNFKILEDSSHALGSKINNEMIGSCKYSDINVLSFHAVKIITTGEGGAITTNNYKLFLKIQKLRSHGIFKKNKGKKIWRYDQKYLGYNYRITDFQCALGRSQLKRIKKIIKKRNKIAKKYDKFFNDHSVDILVPKSKTLSSYHLYVINVPKRDGLYNFLKKNQIETNIHYIPIFMHSYYKKNFKFSIKDFPNTLKYFKSCLSIPIFTQMKSSEQNYILNKIKEFYKW